MLVERSGEGTAVRQGQNASFASQLFVCQSGVNACALQRFQARSSHLSIKCSRSFGSYRLGVRHSLVSRYMPLGKGEVVRLAMPAGSVSARSPTRPGNDSSRNAQPPAMPIKRVVYLKTSRDVRSSAAVRKLFPMCVIIRFPLNARIWM
jgi:hypothetical protein